MTEPRRLWEPIVRVRRAWTDEWQVRPWLRPGTISVGLQPGNASVASFAWSYGLISRPAAASFEEVLPIGADGLAGWWVQVLRPAAEGGDGGANEPAVLWTGRFAERAEAAGGGEALAAGTGDEVLTAYGLETLLDRCPVDGCYALIGEKVIKLDAQPAFNIRHRRGAALAGNRSAAKHPLPTGGTGVPPVDGRESYVFAEDGREWSALDVAEYLLLMFGPSSPRVGLLESAGTRNLDRWRDVWHCPRSVGAGLSALAHRRRGHGWTLTCYGKDPLVQVRPVFGEEVQGAGGVALEPADAIAELDCTARGRCLETVEIRDSETHKAEEIVVLGAPLWVCGAVALQPAWSEDEEAAYAFPPGVPADNLQALDAARRADRFGHVYTAFAAKLAVGKPFVDAAGGALGIPAVNDSGEISFQADTEGPIFALGAVLDRQTPLRVGHTYDTGEEVRRDEAAPDEFLGPIVLAGWPPGQIEQCAPLSAMGDLFGEAANATIGVLDDRPGLRIRGAYGHHFAANHFNGSSQWGCLLDYSDFLATAALRPDTRLRVVERLADKPDPARRIVIELPDAECWILRRGAIVGIGADGQPQRCPKDVVLRNDRGRLAAVAALARAWYGKPRRALRVAWGDLYDELAVGDLVRTALLPGGAREVNTPVSRITWDCALKTTVLETDFAEMDFALTASPPRGAAPPRGGGRVEAAAPHVEARVGPAGRTAGRTGYCTIQINAGDGTYQVDEDVWDVEDQMWRGPEGAAGRLSDAIARDVEGRTTLPAGLARVPFLELVSADGRRELMIDGGRGIGAGASRIAAAHVHYSGANSTGALLTVPNVFHTVIEVYCEARRCSGTTPPADHPGWPHAAEGGGYIGMTFGTVISGWSAASVDWHDLHYVARDVDGTPIGDAAEAIGGIHMQWRVTICGDLEIRLHNDLAVHQNLVIPLVVRVTGYPPEPDMEVGNCCCHEEGDGWGEI